MASGRSLSCQSLSVLFRKMELMGLKWHGSVKFLGSVREATFGDAPPLPPGKNSALSGILKGPPLSVPSCPGFSWHSLNA